MKWVLIQMLFFIFFYTPLTFTILSFSVIPVTSQRIRYEVLDVFLFLNGIFRKKQFYQPSGELCIFLSNIHVKNKYWLILTGKFRWLTAKTWLNSGHLPKPQGGQYGPE